MKTRSALSLTKILFLASLYFFSGCSHGPKEGGPTVILIQGMHLDGESWKGVRERLGSQFLTLDFGRLGRDDLKPFSLKDVAKRSCAGISGQSIIVAHSYGGAIVNRMVGICPEKIAKIIYVAAIVPLKGEKPFNSMGTAENENYMKAVEMKKSKIVPKEPIPFFLVMDPSMRDAVDSQGIGERSYPKIYSEWMTVGEEEIDYDSARFNSIPKVYLYTARDQVIPVSIQKLNVTRAKIESTDIISSGHFPMVTEPRELAGIFLKWMRE